MCGVCSIALRIRLLTGTKFGCPGTYLFWWVLILAILGYFQVRTYIFFSKQFTSRTGFMTSTNTCKFSMLKTRKLSIGTLVSVVNFCNSAISTSKRWEIRSSTAELSASN